MVRALDVEVHGVVEWRAGIRRRRRVTQIVDEERGHESCRCRGFEHLDTEATRVYPAFVYGTLFALLALHVWTLKALLGMKKAPR